MADTGGNANFLTKADDAIDALSRLISKKTGFALLICIIFGILFFSPGLFDIPVTDRDEARFAQASKQMIESGNYADIRIGEEARYQKPIGIYWLQTAFVRAAAFFHGASSLYEIGNYRLVSWVGGLLFIVGTYFLTRRLFGREAAFIAGLTASACGLVVTEAHLAKTDSVLAAATVFSFYALACAWKAYSLDRPEYVKTKHFFIFWGALIIGTMVKGVNIPIILCAILSLSVYERNISWLGALKPVRGLALFAVIVTPWFYYINAHSGGAFAEASVQKDFLQKIFGAVESHGAPPLSHLVAHFAIFFPAALLTPYALTVAFQNRTHESFIFCLLGILPAWVIFELIPTKLPHYTYPLYGLIFALIGGAVITLVSGRCGNIGKRIFLIASVPYLILSGLLTAGLPLLAMKIGVFTGSFFTVLCGLSGVVAIWNVLCLRRELYFSVLWGLCLQAGLLFPYLFGEILPQAREIFPSAQLQKLIHDYDCRKNIYLTGFTEPSARFLLGTDIQFTTTEAAIQKYAVAQPCDIFIIGEKHTNFRAAYPNISAKDIMAGVNVNGNDGVLFEIYQKP